MTDPYGAAPQAAGGQRAFGGWGARVGAVLVDSVPNIVVFTLLTLLFGETETGDGGFAFELSGLPFVVYLVFAIGWFVYNWLLGQGRTGQTLGKRLLGISVLGADTHQPIGPGLTFARQLAHILDALPCGLGYLWPIWDGEKRTFADMIVGTRVYKA